MCRKSMAVVIVVLGLAGISCEKRSSDNQTGFDQTKYDFPLKLSWKYAKHERDVYHWLIRFPPPVNATRHSRGVNPFPSFEAWSQAGAQLRDAEEVLWEFMRDRGFKLPRPLLIYALRAVGTSQSVPELIAILNDTGSDVSLKDEVVLALANIGDRRAVAPMTEAIQTCEESGGITHTVKVFKMNAIMGLGTLGDPKAIPALEAEMKNFEADGEYELQLGESLDYEREIIECVLHKLKTGDPRDLYFILQERRDPNQP